MQAQLSSTPSASAYLPANLTNRIIAAVIDGLLGSLLASLGGVPGILFMLLKDGFWDGRSPGKKVMGLRVINVDTGQPCTFKESAIRHVLMLVPCVNVVYFIIEAYKIVTTNDRRRVSDGWAHTMVIDG